MGINGPLGEPLVEVKKDENGDWSVRQSGNRSGAGTFKKRADALWYASKLAERVALQEWSCGFGCTVRIYRSERKYTDERWSHLDTIKSAADSLFRIAEDLKEIPKEERIELPEDDIPF